MDTTHEKLKENSLNLALKPAVKFSLLQINARAWMSGILALSDAVMLLLAMLAAIFIRFPGINTQERSYYFAFLGVGALGLFIIYALSGLYPAIGLHIVDELRRMSASTTFLFLALAAFSFLGKASENYSRLVFLIAWLFALAALPAGRFITRRLAIRLKVWGEPVSVVGTAEGAVEVARFFTQFPQKGINPIRVFIQEGEVPDEKFPFTVLPVEALRELQAKAPLHTILVVVPYMSRLAEKIDSYRYSFSRVILVQQQSCDYCLNALSVLDFYGILGFEVHHNLLNPWSMMLKRVIDLGVTLSTLAISAPVLALIALCIHLDSPGKVFYRQARLGRGGKVIKLLKFRTMYQNGDEIFARKMLEDPALEAEWEQYQKLKHDPRVTRVGRLLRKFSFDELPQLWNILAGEMSLVGPRPMMVNQREMYGESFQNYIQVRPGLTGLWQVSGRNHTTFTRRAQYDMEYIQRWSLWWDIYILYKTVREVISRDGAY